MKYQIFVCRSAREMKKIYWGYVVVLGVIVTEKLFKIPTYFLLFLEIKFLEMLNFWNLKNSKIQK